MPHITQLRTERQCNSHISKLTSYTISPFQVKAAHFHSLTFPLKQIINTLFSPLSLALSTLLKNKRPSSCRGVRSLYRPLHYSIFYGFNHSQVRKKQKEDSCMKEKRLLVEFFIQKNLFKTSSCREVC